MDSTPTFSRFDDAYKTRTAPWVIGEPQPAIVELERADLVRSRVLDAGCGTGEHTILLTRLGYDVQGVDAAPTAIEQARGNAAEKGVDAHFEVADAMRLAAQPRYDTIVDSALFHIFDDTDRPRYVASLHAACRPGALVHLLALSDKGRGFGHGARRAGVARPRPSPLRDLCAFWSAHRSSMRTNRYESA